MIFDLIVSCFKIMFLPFVILTINVSSFRLINSRKKCKNPTILLYTSSIFHIFSVAHYYTESFRNLLLFNLCCRHYLYFRYFKYLLYIFIQYTCVLIFLYFFEFKIIIIKCCWKTLNIKRMGFGMVNKSFLI